MYDPRRERTGNQEYTLNLKNGKIGMMSVNCTD